MKLDGIQGVVHEPIYSLNAFFLLPPTLNPTGSCYSILSKYIRELKTPKASSPTNESIGGVLKRLLEFITSSASSEP